MNSSPSGSLRNSHKSPGFAMTSWKKSALVCGFPAQTLCDLAGLRADSNHLFEYPLLHMPHIHQRKHKYKHAKPEASFAIFEQK